MEPLLLDGRTGEGGGQLVRLACALAAVTSQPVRITNVRGNRERSPGLKAQHVSAIEWLAKVTKAQVSGLEVGSRTLEFRPTVSPTELRDRKIQIVPRSRGASALLIFQAVFPYLLYAGCNVDQDDANSKMVELEIQGSTNASFSPSFEYVDQVLLPTLEERFGIAVDRELVKRAWTVGPLGIGCVRFRFKPLRPGQALELTRPWDQDDDEKKKKPQKRTGERIERIDVSILVPHVVRQPLERELVARLGREFSEAVAIHFVLYEESGHDARLYVLAVAHAESGLRWGRDYLYDHSAKKKKPEVVAREMAETVTRRLCEELSPASSPSASPSPSSSSVSATAAVDEHLQDQLVVFQALAKGRSTYYWTQETERWQEEDVTEKEHSSTISRDYVDESDSHERGDQGQPRRRVMEEDRPVKPFGFGSLHTTTARWVASELLPTVKWFNNGTICEGAGVTMKSASELLSDLTLNGE